MTDSERIKEIKNIIELGDKLGADKDQTYDREYRDHVRFLLSQLEAKEEEMQERLKVSNDCIDVELDKNKRLTELNKVCVEALENLIGSCTITYESQAKKYLKPEFIGKRRVWSDYSCWLYPGDCIFEVSKEDIEKVNQALDQVRKK